MTALVGDPALRTLLRLKLRGTVRRAGRRLRTPSGLLFAVLGLGLLGSWLFSLRLAVEFGAASRVPADVALPLVRAALAALFVLSLSGNIAHRGLYLPAQEIERLFSAPLGRADLIRHRLHISLGQSLIGGLFLATVAAFRLPHPGTAAIGALLAVATLSIAGQGLALWLGSLERRLPAVFLRRAARTVAILMVVVAAGLYGLLDTLPETLRLDLVGALEHPLTRIATAPFEPWARLIQAGPTLAAWGYGALCVALLVGLFELTARLPIDFRELALATSADVAARLRRLQRGGIAGARELRSASGLRRLPWIAGHGPVGAIVWRKSTGIGRRALVTLGFSSFLLTVLVIASVAISRSGDPEDVLGGAVMVAILGTFYLCSGLRFDFREDLERMDAIKSWPLPAWKVFAAVLLPEAALIAILLCLALVAHAVATDGLLSTSLALVLATPPFAALWLALDNAIFLLWPVRIIPGRDGALHNLGRAAVFVMVRMALLGAMLAVAMVVAIACFHLYQLWFDGGPEVGVRIGFLAGLGVVLASLAATVALGGFLLRRFEPGRLSS